MHARAAALLLGVALCACATTQLERVRIAPGTLPRAVELEHVPFHAQEAYQCGPAALATVLNWSGDPVHPDALAASIYTPALHGSLESALVAGARRHGRVVYRLEGPRELLAEVASGHPVVVFQNLALSWYPMWHWAVVVGYDLDRERVVLRSGDTPRRSTELARFDRTWARSGRVALLVVAPEELPATASEQRYLDAVVALEGAGQPLASARAYRTALERWPNNLRARIGLGNSLYATGDLRRAAEAFREAAVSHPDSAAAHNNLAHTLLELGETSAALRAAHRALALGGPDVETYRATLREIERRRTSPHE